MKVYELIQELVKYEANAEVKISLYQESYNVTTELEDGEEVDVILNLDDIFEIEVEQIGNEVRICNF